MSNRIKVSAVSYVNTYPFIYGLENSGILKNIELSLDYPSECATKLITDKVDLGLVPVAILPELNYYEIVSDFCIGSNGKARTVVLVSNEPLADIKNIYLNSQSRTSNLLLKILLKEYWNLTPKINYPDASNFNLIYDHTAALIIGDEAFSVERKYKYSYDLGVEWKNFTGFPFVFACWVANKNLPAEFIELFSDALNFGINNISCIIEKNYKNISNIPGIRSYLTDNIDYYLDERKYEALNKFIAYINKY